MKTTPASSLRRLAALSGQERLLLAEAFLLLGPTAIGLRMFGFGRCHGFLLRIPLRTRKMDRSREPDLARAVARMVEAAASRSPWKANCLERSLVLWWLLHRQGVTSEIRFGARKEGDRFDAHAWVEHDHRVLNDHPGVEHRFRPFDRPLTAARGRRA